MSLRCKVYILSEGKLRKNPLLRQGVGWACQSPSPKCLAITLLPVTHSSTFNGTQTELVSHSCVQTERALSIKYLKFYASVQLFSPCFSMFRSYLIKGKIFFFSQLSSSQTIEYRGLQEALYHFHSIFKNNSVLHDPQIPAKIGRRIFFCNSPQ